MNATFNIKEVDFGSIEPCAAIALLGKRRTGKTTWCMNILQYLNDSVGRFVAVCGNKDNASEWRTVIHPLFVVQKDLAYLEKLRDYQDTKVSSFTSQQLPIPKKYRICIILDDCGSDRTFMHSKIIKDLLSNGRHYGMSLIILAQYLNQLAAENRDQLDYIGVLHTSNAKNIKKLFEEYVSTGTLREFRSLLNACTASRGMCWIDNTLNPKSIEDFIFFKNMVWPQTFQPVGHQGVRDYGVSHYHTKNPTAPLLVYDSGSDCEAVDSSTILNDQVVICHDKGSVVINKVKIE